MYAGLVNMLNAGAAVQSFKCDTPSASAATCTIAVHGCGRFALYSTAAAAACTVDGATVAAEYSTESSLLTVPVPQTADLEATLEISFAL